MSKTAESYDQLVKILSAKSEIFGLWLGGSRGKGYQDERSDYDLWVIVEDVSAVPLLEKELKDLKLPSDIGVVFKTLKELEELSRWGRHDFWVRYSFTDTKALLDKTGQLQKIIDKIGCFPKNKQRGLIKGALGAYQNSLYRSLKAYFRGNKFAALMEANKSVEHLLVALFALHLRFKPYDSYLEKEIDKLVLLGEEKENLMETLVKIITTAKPDIQLQLKLILEKAFRENNFSESFEEWEETFKGFAKKYL